MVWPNVCLFCSYSFNQAMWLPVRLQFANLFICYDAMTEN